MSMNLRHFVWGACTAFLVACGGGDNPNQSTSFAISGVIPNASDVTVSAEGPASKSVKTDASGNYKIEGLGAGDYTVTPQQEAFSFEPSEAAVKIANSDVVAPAFERKIPEEGMRPEELALADQEPESPLDDTQIILPNGQSLADYSASHDLSPQALPNNAKGPQELKNNIIGTMIKKAKEFACDGDACPAYIRVPGGDDRSIYPLQTKFTYITGGTTPEVPTKAHDACKQLTYGMDCSGLIFNIAKAAGISNPPYPSSAQANPDNWKFPDEWQLKMKVVTDGTIETGDLLVWSDHIGISLEGGKDIDKIHQISSTGTPNACSTNIVKPRGPRMLTVKQLHKGGPVTSVLRIVTTLSGNWDAYLRCTSQTTDAAKIRFSIDNNKGGPFNAVGSGTDYNGTPLSLALSGNYNQLSNVIDGTLFLTDGSRSDSFQQKLLTDDTGYFSMTKVIDNGGCPASLRLVRVLDDAPKPTATATGMLTPKDDLPPSMLYAPNRAK